jgi:AcrR family transcriptional regulator
VPKLWSETIDAHRREVRDAIVRTTVALVDKHGLRAVTMSQIAEAAGIGRATLYKYFPDVEAILLAWHEMTIGEHLRELAELGHGPGRAVERLEAVLAAYAHIQHEHHASELTALLHRGEHVMRAHQHLRDMVCGLLREAASAGDVRKDVAADELATYCLHALAAANTLRTNASVQRLVMVTMAGVRARR